MIWPRLSLAIADDSSIVERRLIRAAQNGDLAAFDSLRSLYEQPLARFIARRAGRHTADDVVQETWISAWQGIRKWNGRARFKAWLFAIAEHKCIDQHRLQARHARLANLSELEGYPSAIPDEYGAIELRQVVQSILVHLPDYQREVIELYYYEELTLLEISQVLKRNLNTVKYQFYRAHSFVAGRLEPIRESLGAVGTRVPEVSGGTKSEDKRTAVPQGPHSGAESIPAAAPAVKGRETEPGSDLTGGGERP